MSADGAPEQLGRLDVERLSRIPGALDEARRNGQLNELLAGRGPGSCPICGRPMADPA
jgi:hypothetical protein